MADIMNIDKQIDNIVKDLPSYDYMLGRGLTQPFSPANSGSRKLMFGVHREHLMIPKRGEVAIIQTGFESEFGKVSSSYVEAGSDYTVIYKIPKFAYRPDNHYYLIVQNNTNGEYDVIERVQYKHNTESYGYMYNNSYIDSLHQGSIINKGDVIKKSNGFDDYNNRLEGVNLTTLYLSCDQNMEDSIILSQSAADKLESTLIQKPSVTINDNDILLNLYGDDNIYKAFPDIGERTENGIFCGVRRLENENILYSLSQSRLKDIMMSDKKIVLNGTIVDIDIYCNNSESLSESYYNQQLYFYYQQGVTFRKTINDLVAPLAMNGKLSYDLHKLYSRCRDAIDGKQYYKDNQFNNVVMEVTIVEDLLMNKGDKLSDRYGGKGVVSEVRPDYLMPKLDNGNIVDVIKNQSTCINRENLGQLHEQSLTFMGSRIIDYFKTGVLSYSEMAELWYDFVSEINPSQAKNIMSSFDLYDENEAKVFIDSILEDDAIILSLMPFTSGINIDKLNDIYKKFDWIKPYKVSMPMKGSNDDIRYTEARRTLIIGKIYNYRLKQYSEEKFSVTSLSATNLKNLNAKSKANKLYEARFTKTPIMFGPMETGNLSHLGMQYVIMNLMLYSSSPQGRRLFEQLLTGNPYNIDIKLDKDSNNRNAEIINTIFKAMGVKLVFKKVPKNKKVMFRRVMLKDIPNMGFNYKTNIRDIIGTDDELRTKYNIAMRDKTSKRMMLKTMMVDAKK